MRAGRALGWLLAWILVSAPVVAQVSGTIFEDRDGDGIHDPGEPTLEGVSVGLYGSPDAGGAVDSSVTTGADGLFQFSPGNGCYLLSATDPDGWRPSRTREDGYVNGTAPFGQPVGQPRFSKLDRLIDNLKNGTVRYSAMGDSIAYNFNACSFPPSFWYSDQFRSRLACVAPTASLTLDESAVKGEHSDDLLWDDTNSDSNNVFRTLENRPEMISISIIGNDLLNVDLGDGASQVEINRSVSEVLDARQNLQETLSVLIAELPDTDIVLNTLYDNEAYNCYSGSPSEFHRSWIPIVSRILRDIAWGQARRVTNAEIAAEFAHEDQLGGCTGFPGLICRDLFGLDNIHPRDSGFDVILEKLWESAGGVSLGSGDVLGRTTAAGVDYGYLRRVRRLLPTTWEERDGATAANPEAALDDQDGGAAASIALGAAQEEFRLGGFPDWYDEIQIVRAIAGVRFRTSGTVNDDFYRIEASITDRFRPDPGHAYTPTDWNFYTPIVGGGGPNQPPENPDYPLAVVLAVPDVAAYRETSATLTKNPVLPPGAADYQWPAPTHEELATTTIRVAAAPVAATAGNDPYQVELDYAWLDLYGWEKDRPDEVSALTLDRLADGALQFEFDGQSGAQRYNLYAGTIDALRGDEYDHGAEAPAGPLCDATTADAGGGRTRIDLPAAQQPAASSYFLVTVHVDDVESPAGQDSAQDEIDRAQSICR